MKNWRSIILFSAISAAFIGPGTVATCAAAGSRFQFRLLWALLFSTLACWILQEASARLTVTSGQSLGQVLANQFGRSLAGTVVLSIVLGCAAYQAGNILGSFEGLKLLAIQNATWGVALIGGLAFAFLWLEKTTWISRILASMVALMGLGFFFSALKLQPEIAPLLQGTFVPSLPQDATALILGLVGTTVVPYNLFLGSSLAHHQKLSDVRLGLSIAIPFGGLISAAILVVGTTVDGPFSYAAVADALAQHWGNWPAKLFGLGLFCAGLSSAITAPWAAQLSFSSLFPPKTSVAKRAVWMLVLLTGMLFGWLQVKPIPIIILAQALNGLILPLVAIFLFIATNDRNLMGVHLNNRLFNLVMGLATLVSLLLGCNGLLKAFTATFPILPQGQTPLWLTTSIATIALFWPVLAQVRKRRN